MQQLVNAFNVVIINPLLLLLFAAGLAVFMFGMVEFFFGFSVQGQKDAKEMGKRHMLWGVVGMFIMSSAWAIINVILDTVRSLSR